MEGLTLKLHADLHQGSYIGYRRPRQPVSRFHLATMVSP